MWVFRAHGSHVRVIESHESRCEFVWNCQWVGVRTTNVRSCLYLQATLNQSEHCCPQRSLSWKRTVMEEILITRSIMYSSLLQNKASESTYQQQNVLKSQLVKVFIQEWSDTTDWFSSISTTQACVADTLYKSLLKLHSIVVPVNWVLLRLDSGGSAHFSFQP